MMAGTDRFSIRTGQTARQVDRLERAKKAVMIATQSPYHRARILDKKAGETALETGVKETTLDTIAKEVQKMTSFDGLDRCLSHSEEVYKKLRSEVAEIASSSDTMLQIGEITSSIAQPLSTLPFDFGTKIHNVIRAFFKLAFEEALGDDKFNQKPDTSGSIFNPYKEEPPKLKGAEEDPHAKPKKKTSENSQTKPHTSSLQRSKRKVKLNDALYNHLHEGIKSRITDVLDPDKPETLQEAIRFC